MKPSFEYDNKYYPKLATKLLAIDIETSGLNCFSDTILGIAIARPCGFKEYYNFSSECGVEGPVGNNIEKNKAYIKELLADCNIAKIGAYLPFDVGFLTCKIDAEGREKENFPVAGKLIDVQAAEYVINENLSTYSLDSLLRKYRIGSKQSEVPIMQLLKMDAFPSREVKEPDKHFRKYLWKLRYEHIREYAIGDVAGLFGVWTAQKKIIAPNGLWNACSVEFDMIHICNQMLQNGSRIDVQAARDLSSEYGKILDDEIYTLAGMVGHNVNVNSNKQLETLFTAQKIPFNRDPKTNNGIFDAAALTALQEYPIGKKILGIRVLTGIKKNVVDKYLKMQIGGYLHGKFHSTRNGQSGGTVTGRLSSTGPNMQNIPARDEKYELFFNLQAGKDIRSFFIPENGCQWGTVDLSQIEYRTLCHFGVGQGAQIARDNYNRNPQTDYHQFVMNLTKLSRKPAKTCNFLLVYRGSAPALAKNLGCDLATAKGIMQQYYHALPFVKETPAAVEAHAKKVGYVQTILGRRLHFDKARDTYFAFAKLNQGTAADILKCGLVKAWHEGIFDTLKLHSTVHDENNVSVPLTNEGTEAFKRLQYFMENTTKLKVPIYSEAGLGKNWHEAK